MWRHVRALLCLLVGHGRLCLWRTAYGAEVMCGWCGAVRGEGNPDRPIESCY